ncbi:MAG: mechanosensitive ion channel [Bacteroidota bacterium]|nr:mechanosensitive ion channel [Bacteroidota bacterium]
MDINNTYNLISEKLVEWYESFILMLPNLAMATVVFIIFIFIAKGVRNVAEKIFRRISHSENISGLLSSITYGIIFGIGLFTALSILQLDKAVTSILAGAGIIGLAIGFAFQDIAANFVSGILLSFKRPFRTGDIIKSQDYMGVVKKVNLRSTVILSFQGQMILIPNKDVFQNPLQNYTRTNKRRVDLEVGVSYGEDLEKVKRVTIEAAKKVEGRTNDEITFFYTGFGDSSIDFTVRVWPQDITQPGYLKLKSDLIMNIKKAFDENDIMIPFPIRTLDFGIKGGEKLNEIIDFKSLNSSKN